MREFKVGDVCRIRQWDDMKEEFGVNVFGQIPCRRTFIDAMAYLCGALFTVKYVDKDLCKSEEGVERSFFISADMLEYALPEEPECDAQDDVNLACLFT